MYKLVVNDKETRDELILDELTKLIQIQIYFFTPHFKSYDHTFLGMFFCHPAFCIHGTKYALKFKNVTSSGPKQNVVDFLQDTL